MSTGTIERFADTPRDMMGSEDIAMYEMDVAAESARLLHEAFTPDYERGVKTVEFTDVTPRDGLQQGDIKKGVWLEDKEKYAGLTTQERLDMFDHIVSTGIQTVEIGHLGNEEDRPFARALVEHIAAKSEEDDRYKDVKLQVLFHADPTVVEPGLEALDGFDPDRVVIHLYNRISPGLRSMMGIDEEESAEMVVGAADAALGLGYTSFSISGEGAVDHAQDQQVVIDFHNTISEHLLSNGAMTVNVNLANTWGSSPAGEWDEEGLAHFYDEVTSINDRYENASVTASVHTHDDYKSAVEFTLTAIRAGFDRVEGSLIGMGERAGNTALIDVFTRYVEQAVADYEVIERAVRQGKVSEEVMALRGLKRSLLRERKLPSRIVDNLRNSYEAAEEIGEIAETKRFERTAVGNDHAFQAASGPHGEGAYKYYADPLRVAYDKTYGRNATVHAELGGPIAQEIKVMDADRMQAIIEMNHTAGKRTKWAHKSEMPTRPTEDIEIHVGIEEARRDIVRAYMAHDMEMAG